MLYRAENISVFVEGCNFKIKCPKKLQPAGDYCHLKVSTLKVKELNDPYSSPNIIRVIKSRRMRWAEHVACMKKRKEAYRILVGKPDVKRPHGRPKHR